MERMPQKVDGALRLSRRRLASLLWATIAILCLASVAQATPTQIHNQLPRSQSKLPRFEAAACPFQEYRIPVDEQIDCGYLVVPEERSQANSRPIQLAVAIIRTHDPTPAPDPLVFLQGGPGISGLDSVDYFVAQAAGLRAERDIILLDQRGTGYSLPNLRCGEFTELYASLQAQNLTWETQRPLEIEAAQLCRNRLLGDGVNLAAYNTAANAADVNDLRIALGYATLNLYGFSYGSRLALTVMRDFPQGVRSAVLDSALPLQAGWWEEQAADAERAYAVLFAGCAKDPACQAAYPQVEPHFYAIVERFNATPLLINTRDATGAAALQLFGGDDLVSGGFQALYDQELIPYLPLAIEQIYAGNTDVIAGLAGQLAGDASVSMSGMWFSVECQDEAPFNDPQKIATNADAHPHFRNFVMSDPTPAICAVWGVEPSPAIETEAVQSDIPALVLAGEYDPIHPPAWSRLAASTLPHSFFYAVPGASHGVGFDGCGQTLVVNFIQSPTVAPDASCVAQQSGPAFITDLYLNPGVYRLASALLLDADWVAALPLLISLLFSLSVLLVWPVALLTAWQRRQPMAASLLGRWMAGISFMAALLDVGFFVALLLVIVDTSTEQPYLLLFGLPSQAAPLFVIPWISLFLGTGLLAMSVLLWHRRSGSVVVWLYYTMVALAVVGFVGVLASWGLIRIG
jgi:pimeloyl-ACP methyl ester carboxylesterase